MTYATSAKTAQPTMEWLPEVLEFIQERGNLQNFHANRQDRLLLLKAALGLDLICWNSARGKFELTEQGCRRIDSNK